MVVSNSLPPTLSLIRSVRVILEIPSSILNLEEKDSVFCEREVVDGKLIWIKSSQRFC